MLPDVMRCTDEFLSLCELSTVFSTKKVSNKYANYVLCYIINSMLLCVHKANRNSKPKHKQESIELKKIYRISLRII